jgi:hypothetical protein
MSAPVPKEKRHRTDLGTKGLIEKIRFAPDSPLEEAVTSEPVSV